MHKKVVPLQRDEVGFFHTSQQLPLSVPESARVTTIVGITPKAKL